MGHARQHVQGRPPARRRERRVVLADVVRTVVAIVVGVQLQLRRFCPRSGLRQPLSIEGAVAPIRCPAAHELDDAGHLLRVQPGIGDGQEPAARLARQQHWPLPQAEVDGGMQVLQSLPQPGQAVARRTGDRVAAVGFPVHPSDAPRPRRMGTRMAWP